MKELKYKHIDETIYTEQLTNGLTVFLLPRPEMSKVYGFFSTNYGSIDQTFVPLGQEEFITVPEGVAHFLEHKLFEKEEDRKSTRLNSSHVAISYAVSCLHK